jgi:hypothetical protein
MAQKYDLGYVELYFNLWQGGMVTMQDLYREKNICARKFAWLLQTQKHILRLIFSWVFVKT